MPTPEEARTQLLAAGREINQHGWVPATSGNFSCRLAQGDIAITVSGRHKGRLQDADIMTINARGESLDGKKPSAETALHVQLYNWRADIGAVLHTHSPNSTVLSRLGGDVLLQNYELFKAFSGQRSHDQSLRVPVFANDQNMERLASKVGVVLDDLVLPGYLIAGHGLYAWGCDVDEAMRHVEAFEFIFQCELETRKVKPV